MKKFINVEIFPVAKTCEQGCSHCPLARKESALTTATEIDTNVQGSFTALENALRLRDAHYDLHFSSTLHLFPALQYPELIDMSRFETGIEVREPNGPERFSKNIRAVLKKNNMNPKVIGFSLVPLSPVVSAKDALVVDEIIGEIAPWHFIKPYRSIRVTVRSNLVEPRVFREVYPHLLDADRRHLKKVIREHTSHIKLQRKLPLKKEPWLYHNEYTGNDGSLELTISNRVIMREEGRATLESYWKQAARHVRMAEFCVDFAIAPKGVMLIHTSRAINNPMLWMSHKDFHWAIGKEMERKKPSFHRMIANIIITNAALYKTLHKFLQEKRKGTVLTEALFMDSCENLRPKHCRYFNS